MNRRVFIALLASQALALAGEARAQSSTRTYRIAVLLAGTPATGGRRIEEFKAGLRDFGYDEARNAVFDVRYAEGKYERLSQLSLELVGRRPDVIMSVGTPALLALKKATTTIPIVMAASSDPEATGLVASLASPGGNITGNAILNTEMMLKRIELLGELSAGVAKVAIFMNPDNRASLMTFDATLAATASTRIRIERFAVRSPNEIDSAFSMASARKMDAAIIDEDVALRDNFKGLAQSALKYRMPTCGPFDFADAGGLLGFGPDTIALYRRAAYFVDKILKGVKPADLPVERVATFTLVVNQGTARGLDIKMPLSIMQRADKVID